jgi:hypothetical protein
MLGPYWPMTWLLDSMAWVWFEGPAILLGLTFPTTAAILPLAVVRVAVRPLGL